MTLHNQIAKLRFFSELSEFCSQNRIKTETFFQTAEGIALKEQLNAEKEAAATEFHAHDNAALEEIKKYIKDNLGAHWTVKFLSDDSLDLAVWDADKADFVFGQTIEIRFERHYYWKDGAERFETNVGSTGCFEIGEQNPGDRARFYIDLGRFLSLELRWLKNYLFNFKDEREVIRNRVRKANALLENPLGL